MHKWCNTVAKLKARVWEDSLDIGLEQCWIVSGHKRGWVGRTIVYNKFEVKVEFRHQWNILWQGQCIDVYIAADLRQQINDLQDTRTPVGFAREGSEICRSLMCDCRCMNVWGGGRVRTCNTKLILRLFSGKEAGVAAGKGEGELSVMFLLVMLKFEKKATLLKMSCLDEMLLRENMNWFPFILIKRTKDDARLSGKCGPHFRNSGNSYRKYTMCFVFQKSQQKQGTQEGQRPRQGQGQGSWPG